MTFVQSPVLPRRRALSATEIAAVAAAAVTACPAPRNVPGGIDRLRRAGGTWARRRSEPVTNDAPSRLGPRPASAERPERLAGKRTMAVFRDDLVVLLPELRAVARSLTRGDGPLADDMVQDALASALKCQHQFMPGTNLKAWLLTIVRNKFLSAVSRKHVTSEVHEEDLERRIGLRRNRRAGSRSWRSSARSTC